MNFLPNLGWYWTIAARIVCFWYLFSWQGLILKIKHYSKGVWHKKVWRFVAILFKHVVVTPLQMLHLLHCYTCNRCNSDELGTFCKLFPVRQSFPEFTPDFQLYSYGITTEYHSFSLKSFGFTVIFQIDVKNSIKIPSNSMIALKMLYNLLIISLLLHSNLKLVIKYEDGLQY